jgi:YD repeat-containing protein
VILPYINSIISYDPLTGFRSVTSYTLDNYGNITVKGTSSRKKGVPPEYTESITFSGYSPYGNWGVPNKPQSILISRSLKSQAAVTKEVVFTYDSNGSILTETTYPGTAKAVTKTYTYNLLGNFESVTESAQGLIPRISSYQYDSKNRFITSIEQPDSNSISYTRDPGTGNALSETAIDSKITTYQYDAFGRLKKVITPLGHEIVTSINWENALPDIPALYKVQTAAPGRPDVINYYDKLGRIIRTESEAPGGSVIQDKYYNPDGTIEKVTYPYRSGDAQKWIEYGYDEYGRLISENNNTLTTTYHYGKDSTKIILPSGKKETTIFNSQSQVIQVIDNDNTITSVSLSRISI